jgi:hypothetical protein
MTFHEHSLARESAGEFRYFAHLSELHKSAARGPNTKCAHKCQLIKFSLSVTVSLSALCCSVFAALSAPHVPS